MADIKAAARATIRQLRDANFGTWYSHLGPYQALKLQEQHAAQIAVSNAGSEQSAVDTGPVEASVDAGPPPSELGFIKNDDGSVQRLKIPEKDVRMKAIVYLSRFQKYLEDLPPRQVMPPKCKPVGMRKSTTEGDALGEIGRLEDALNEGMVEPENVAAVLLQVGRLRDFVSDNRLCRKRLNRLIDKEVALPSQRMEAHRIIAGNYLRAGMDADEEQAAHTAHHVRQWLALTPVEHMKTTLRVCTQWLRDRLHLDSLRMELLEQWSRLELEADTARLQAGVLQAPNPEVFVELAFHCIRQEKYTAALGWISTVIEFCPGVVEQLDDILNRTTAVSQLPTTLGGLQPIGDDATLNGPNAVLFSSLFYRGHLKKSKRADRAVTAPDSLGGSRGAQRSTPEERRAAIERALAGSSQRFITPGPGHYDIEPGIGKQAVSFRKTAPTYTFGDKLDKPLPPPELAGPGPGEYHVPLEPGLEAPAASFQSRTLFGSVYAAEVRHHLGLPAPTSYNPTEYSHVRARWRAGETAKRLLSKLEPKLSEAIPSSATLAPTMLKHVDYSVHPKFADSVLVPPERVAPAQVGRAPVPPLPEDVKLGSLDMMAGSYTGYSVADTIRPGKANDRLAKLTASAIPGYVAPLGGVLVSAHPVPVAVSTLDASMSGFAPAATAAFSGTGMSATSPTRATSSSGRRRERSDPLQALLKEAQTTGYVPAPLVKPGGTMAHAERWREANTALERAAEIPGPGYNLPALPSGLSYSIQGKYEKEIIRDSANDGEGGGPGVCRYDSAFGRQVHSMHATQPFATFESRETSTRLAPVMNLRAIQAGDDTHDKLATANTGMRETVTSDTIVKGLPGVGTYDVAGYDLAAQSAVKYSVHGKALYHARAAAAKRNYG